MGNRTGKPPLPYVDGVDTKDGRMFQADIVEWAADPMRLEKSVYTHGGGPPEKPSGEWEYVRFLAYHRLNPEVFTMAASMATRMRRAHGAVGARQIMERFRYELRYGVNRPEGQEEVRLNNSHIPFYGRLLAYAGAIPLDLEMFSTKRKGEPGWWADFLLDQLHKEADTREARIQMEQRAYAANAVRMNGTDEAPPVVLP